MALAAALLVAPVLAQGFPLTITHKFGTTIIPDRPERVASLDYNGADNLLALGVQPVTVRYWFGDYPRAVWPWADALLDGQPEILRGDLNFEQIAATEPDVIVALYSGITDKDYEKLVKIAPVVAVPEGIGDYELPWDRQVLIAGAAVGKLAEAEAGVRAVREAQAAVVARHPDWAGKTVAIGTVWQGEVHVYTVSDPRVELLTGFGFVNQPQVEALSNPGEFSVALSNETPEPLDADVLIWFADEGKGPIETARLRRGLTAANEGREIFLGPLATGALSHTSLLSLPYVFELLEPMIALAIDGDPETVVPEAE
jgi:iron complex transport system substrate-binding protein